MLRKTWEDMMLSEGCETQDGLCGRGKSRGPAEGHITSAIVI